MPTKTTETSPKGAKKKAAKKRVKLVNPTRVALDAHANRLHDLETEIYILRKCAPKLTLKSDDGHDLYAGQVVYTNAGPTAHIGEVSTVRILRTEANRRGAESWPYKITDGKRQWWWENCFATREGAIAALGQAAKPADPPPAEKWVPKVGDYFVPVRKNTSGWPGWSSAMDALIGTVRRIEGFQPENRDGIASIGYSEWDWSVADCRPATSAEIAEHKRNEEWAKITELQEGDACEVVSSEERQRILALARNAGIIGSGGSYLYPWLFYRPNNNIRITCSSGSSSDEAAQPIQELTAAEWERRLLGTIARLKTEAEARELAMPLKMGARVRFRDAEDWMISIPWPDSDGDYVLARHTPGRDPNPFVIDYCKRDKFTVIPSAMDSSETKAGPYTVIAKGWRFFIEGPTAVDYSWDHRAVAEVHCAMLNAAYAAGQASREHSPDIVERVMNAVNDWYHHAPRDKDQWADLRTRLTSLFKPQPSPNEQRTETL